MGVIYIGDRATGKTHLAMELANPKSEYVKVISPDYDQLKSVLYDEEQGGTKATRSDLGFNTYSLEIQVKLPTRSKKLIVDWIDSPGEVWRQTWQKDNAVIWNKLVDKMRQSEGILLIISPYRQILKPDIEQPEDFVTQQQWCKRFELWVDFFRYECPNPRHILICLNKADLFCDIKQEALKLAYDPNGSQMNWQQRDSYVVQKYFRPIQDQLEQLNKNISGLSVRCFITSIYNRSLLELPWIYLGSFLAK